MSNEHTPVFINHPSCSEKGYDPEWWHPPLADGTGSKYAHTPEADLAREICGDCPAKVECLEYALGYSNLSGIWAGTDMSERINMAKGLDTQQTDWMSTYNLSAWRTNLVEVS